MKYITKKIAALSGAFLTLVNLNGCVNKKVSTTISQPNQTNEKVKRAETIYKDGSLVAEKQFRVPENYINTLSLTVAIESDKVKNINYEGKWDDDMSKKINETYIPQMISQMIGKGSDQEIDGITGATLSVTAFKEVVQEAFTQAKK